MPTAPVDEPSRRRYTEPGHTPVEVALPAGDVTEGVVRVGQTVRRPHQVQSLAIAAYLDHLERVGFDGSPRYLGRDGAGRDVLSYLPGRVAGDPPEAWASDLVMLASVGRLVRRLHAASAGFLVDRGFAAPPGSVWASEPATVPDEPGDPPPDDPELVSHLDVTPQNVVVRDGLAVGLLDFDLAGPTTRMLDAYNTAMHWVPLRDPVDVWPTWAGVDQLHRLRVFADAYGLDRADRERLPVVGVLHARRTMRRMRARADQLGGGWARMWAAGVGDLIARRETWLAEHRDELLGALLD